MSWFQCKSRRFLCAWLFKYEHKSQEKGIFWFISNYRWANRSFQVQYVLQIIKYTFFIKISLTNNIKCPLPLRSRGPFLIFQFGQKSKLLLRNPKWAAPHSHIILFAFSRNPETNLLSVCVLILQVRMSPSVVFLFCFGSYHYDSLLNKELFCCHIQELC